MIPAIGRFEDGDLIYLALMLKYSGKFLFSTLNMVLILSSILHLAVGITCTTLKPNRLIGLRFPWLLSNEIAWWTTHRISAYIPTLSQPSVQ
ncbi:SdpI family protein [Paenibacillus sp. 23TSA30-6]|uniref:SdpI family protein n=1 Tax=Paenibacillus sp. 23TSA30-6 TaxID=2546104 RepID=UPI001787E96E|nr:SdpI family protein [Paenibacillus sp. 23TSA30-6]